LGVQVPPGLPNWSIYIKGDEVKIFDYFKRAKTFLVEVRSEFKKVTWPPRKEVYGTTIVVIITVFFFGFYLYGLDVAMSYLAATLTRLVGA
jgi:preprotein translocase subunit SecE